MSNILPNQAIPKQVPLHGNWAYQIGKTGKRFYLFGRVVTRWRYVTRAQFYSALMAAEAISPRSDFEACDIMLAGGHVYKIGPFQLRMVPA